jgi:hypothetical protein
MYIFDRYRAVRSSRSVFSEISRRILVDFNQNTFNTNPLTAVISRVLTAREYQIPEQIYQYTGSYQQEWGYKLVSTIGYVGSKGRNLFLRSVANQILPGSTTILNGANIPTGFGVVNRTNATGQVVGVNTVRQFSIVSGTTVNNPYAEGRLQNIRRQRLIQCTSDVADAGVLVRPDDEFTIHMGSESRNFGRIQRGAHLSGVG